jgi:hypothetical protein
MTDDVRRAGLILMLAEGQSFSAIREILAPKRSSADPIRGTFSTYFLEHDYDLFGSSLPR